jgi:hypothetical protein
MNKQVKDNWDDSSDEEMECTVAEVPVAEQEKADRCPCYVCNHELENDTEYLPQCENSALLNGGNSPPASQATPPLPGNVVPLPCEEGGEACDAGGDYPPYEEGGEGDYPPEEEYDSEGSYDDECDAMDKKMGNYVMCR